MGITRVGPVERVLLRVLLPICILSGGVVAAGFFFPEFIGESISGEWWIGVALLFFGSGLGYLALLPTDMDEISDPWDISTLLRVQHRGVRETIAGFWRHHDSARFGIPALALLIFFSVQQVAESQFLHIIGSVQRFFTEQLGWVFILTIGVSVLICVYLTLSKWGSIRLGGVEATPKFTFPVYFSLFFTAGIAAGIVFSGPAEPILHYGNPPPLLGAEAASDQAVTGALAYSLFHWGFSAWSAYLLLGLPIAYYVYQHDAPLRVSAILTPILGVDRLSSPLAKTVDILAIFATIGGIATSVALVSQQFLIGVDFQWDVVIGFRSEALFIIGLTVIFVLSAQSGVHRGIRRLAGVTMILFATVSILVILGGPTAAIGSTAGSGGSMYVRQFVPMSTAFGSEWIASWTVWNWVWWFSWAPFAGLFLAALSRGRTIRTVVLTGVGATGLATMTWFVILGGTALHIQHAGVRDILGAIESHQGGQAVAGFPILETLPLSDVLIFLFLALIIVFMATSADTSTLIVAVLASADNHAPSTGTIVFWGIVQGIVALLVLVSGSEELLQATAVLAGGPFAIIGLIAMGGLIFGIYRHESPGRSLPLILYQSLTNRLLDRNSFDESDED